MFFSHALVVGVLTPRQAPLSCPFLRFSVCVHYTSARVAPFDSQTCCALDNVPTHPRLAQVCKKKVITHFQECQFVGDDGGFHHLFVSVSLHPQRTRKVEGSRGFTRPLVVHSTRLPSPVGPQLVIARCKVTWFQGHPCCEVTLHDFHCAPGAV